MKTLLRILIAIVGLVGTIITASKAGAEAKELKMEYQKRDISIKEKASVEFLEPEIVNSMTKSNFKIMAKKLFKAYLPSTLCAVGTLTAEECLK